MVVLVLHEVLQNTDAAVFQCQLPRLSFFSFTRAVLPTNLPPAPLQGHRVTGPCELLAHNLLALDAFFSKLKTAVVWTLLVLCVSSFADQQYEQIESNTSFIEYRVSTI